MSKEEIIKEVENLIIVFADATTDRGYTYEEQISAEEQLKTIQGLLDLYNREKEKTKKLKDLSEEIVNKFEKQGEIISKLARAIMFMGTNPDITEEEVIKTFTENPITEEFLDKFKKQFIDKDKIRELIKEELPDDKIMETCSIYDINGVLLRKKLEELLEE